MEGGDGKGGGGARLRSFVGGVERVISGADGNMRQGGVRGKLGWQRRRPRPPADDRWGSEACEKGGRSGGRSAGAGPASADACRRCCSRPPSSSTAQHGVHSTRSARHRAQHTCSQGMTPSRPSSPSRARAILFTGSASSPLSTATWRRASRGREAGGWGASGGEATAGAGAGLAGRRRVLSCGTLGEGRARARRQAPRPPLPSRQHLASR